jgi:hypothetical protein
MLDAPGLPNEGRLSSGFLDGRGLCAFLHLLERANGSVNAIACQHDCRQLFGRLTGGFEDVGIPQAHVLSYRTPGAAVLSFVRTVGEYP